MILYGIMIFVILAAVGLVSFLFYLLKKEETKPQDVIPVTDLTELGKEKEVKEAVEEIKSVEVNEGPVIIEIPQPLNFDIPVHEPLSVATAVSPQEEEAYQKRVAALEAELKEISEKAVGQAQEALNMIDQLNKENVILKLDKESQIAEQKAKLQEVTEHLAQLKQDNVTLQVQLDTSHSKIRFLEDEVLAVKVQLSKEITKANALIEEYHQKEAKFTPPPIDSQIQKLTEDNETLMQANVDFQKSIQKLKELNDHLMEKSDTLQYELIKSRAQSTGLERICDNYRRQVEDMVKGVPSSRFASRLPLNTAALEEKNV